MAREFLGGGWSLPCEIDSQGQIVEAREEDKVRQAIETLLRTAPGERLMRPAFGCGIHELVFDNVSSDLLGKIQSAVSSALQLWEPRIDVLGVEAEEDASEPTRLLIQISYRIRSSNSRFNLVFPFYLQ